MEKVPDNQNYKKTINLAPQLLNPLNNKQSLNGKKRNKRRNITRAAFYPSTDSCNIR